MGTHPRPGGFSDRVEATRQRHAPPAASARTGALPPEHGLEPPKAEPDRRPSPALVVFVFRGPTLEYWRFEVADGWPAPIDVLARSVARYGAEPTAVLVAWMEVFGDDRKAVRIRVTAEHGQRRAVLTQVLDVGADTVGPLMPGELGEVEGPTWMGDGPTIELEFVGHAGMREGTAEA